MSVSNCSLVDIFTRVLSCSEAESSICYVVVSNPLQDDTVSVLATIIAMIGIHVPDSKHLDQSSENASTTQSI